ncbi:MAG: NAD(P)-dependent oxidoreductase [Pseudomonadota bacterium]|nr:NAD(P)-dependent oxidoreductase [Pseudomonadota bacterium]
MKIGFIGLGNMGAAIAANLLRAGHDVAVWNRTGSKATSLVQAGAVLLNSAMAVATDSDVVFSMLADDLALLDVLEGKNGLAAGLKQGALHVSLSTIAVATADRVAVRHGELRQRFLCAPVFGRPEAAAAAKLYVVAAGEGTALEVATPLLHSISQRVFYIGETPSAASLVKLCGNFLILSAIEALGEASALAEKGGVPKKQLMEILTSSVFDSPLYRNYGAIIVEERYKPAGFAAPLGLKDMRLTAQSADTLRVPMPLLSLLRDHLLQTIAQQGEDVDWSAIASTSAQNAGLQSKQQTV